MTSLYHQLSGPSEVIWRRPATDSVVQGAAAPISVMPGLLGLTVTGHASTPLFAMPAYPTERACPGRTRFRAESQLASAANEVDERILRLNISRWGARRQKIDHSDRLDTTEGHHAEHDTDDIGPDQC